MNRSISVIFWLFFEKSLKSANLSLKNYSWPWSFFAWKGKNLVSTNQRPALSSVKRGENYSRKCKKIVITRQKDFYGRNHERCEKIPLLFWHIFKTFSVFSLVSIYSSLLSVGFEIQNCLLDTVGTPNKETPNKRMFNTFLYDPKYLPFSPVSFID